MWIGEKEIASIGWNGGIGWKGRYHNDFNNMFDGDDDTFMHSSNVGQNEGPSVKFKKPIIIKNVRILTRKNCCNNRYKRMCLFVDDEKITCTGYDFYPGKSEWINLKVS